MTESCTKPDIWANYIDVTKATDVAALKSRKTLPRLSDRLRCWLRIYIGQSVSVVARICGTKGHIQAVLQTDKRSLLYWSTGFGEGIPRNFRRTRVTRRSRHSHESAIL